MSTKTKKKKLRNDEKRIEEYREKIKDSQYIDSAIARLALLLSKNLVENKILERTYNG